MNNTPLGGHSRVQPDDPVDSFDNYETHMEKLFEQFSAFKKSYDSDQEEKVK